jgi:hypothetical protein
MDTELCTNHCHLEQVPRLAQALQGKDRVRMTLRLMEKKGQNVADKNHMGYRPSSLPRPTLPVFELRGKSGKPF